MIAEDKTLKIMNKRILKDVFDILSDDFFLLYIALLPLISIDRLIAAILKSATVKRVFVEDFSFNQNELTSFIESCKDIIELDLINCMIFSAEHAE